MTRREEGCVEHELRDCADGSCMDGLGAGVAEVPVTAMQVL
jgi:hypothetical protein